MTDDDAVPGQEYYLFGDEKSLMKDDDEANLWMDVDPEDEDLFLCTVELNGKLLGVIRGASLDELYDNFRDLVYGLDYDHA